MRRVRGRSRVEGGKSRGEKEEEQRKEKGGDSCNN